MSNLLSRAGLSPVRRDDRVCVSVGEDSQPDLGGEHRVGFPPGHGWAGQFAWYRVGLPDPEDVADPRDERRVSGNAVFHEQDEIDQVLDARRLTRLVDPGQRMQLLGELLP